MTKRKENHMNAEADAASGNVLLAFQQGFGHVWRCPRGCIHVAIRDLSVRISETDLDRLQRMLNEARQQAARVPVEAGHLQ